jgi:RNA polymerase sigma-70 factor (ECF subfamily)
VAGHGPDGALPAPEWQTIADELRQLIEATARGEASALGALYDATSAAVYSLALRMLGDAAAAEDVTIDVYLDVCRRSPPGAAPDRPVAWLLSLARRRALDRLRSGQSPPEREPRPGREAARPGPDSGPPEPAELTGRRHVAERALAALAPAQRLVIEAAYFRGLDRQEIASALGMPPDTVTTLMSQGMLRLRELLYSVPGEKAPS